MTWVPSISSAQRPRPFFEKSLKPFLSATQESPRPAGEPTPTTALVSSRPA